jgi:tetratricopeptide (TPR) repeat protein
MFPSLCRDRLLTGSARASRHVPQTWASLGCGVHDVRRHNVRGERWLSLSKVPTKRTKKHSSKKKQSDDSSRNRSVVQDDGLPSSVMQPLLAFRYASQEGNIAKVVELYPRLMAEGVLNGQDSVEIIRILHHAARQKSPLLPKAELADHARTFVEHYRSGQLSPHPRASVHILAIYRDLRDYQAAVDFWNWALKAQSQYLSLPTYGTAIELMALAGQPLEACEALYTQALQEFRRDFNDYLLSEGSVITQPNQPTTASGTSTTLLQGIIIARLLHGDWQGAYLALDTVFRVHPTHAPDYICQSFLDHRPLDEALKVLELYCRSGSAVRPSTFTRTMVQITALISKKGQTLAGRKALDTLVDVLNYGFSTHQKLDVSHFHLFLQALVQNLPHKHGLDADQAAEADQLSLSIVNTALQIFAGQGVMPNGAVFSKIAAAAIHGENPALAMVAIRGCLDTDCEVDVEVARNLIFAAGTTGNVEDLEALWTALCTKVPSLRWDSYAWKSLLHVATKLRNPQLFHRILNNDTVLHAADKKRLYDMKKPEHADLTTGMGLGPTATSPGLGDADRLNYYRLLLEKLITTQNRLAGKKAYDVSSLAMYAMATGPRDVRYPEEWYENLYHELNVRPLSPNQQTASSPWSDEADAIPTPDPEHEASTTLPAGARTPTGFTMAEVRYSNWKAITDLLLRAKGFEEKNAYHGEHNSGVFTPARSVTSMYNDTKKRGVMLKQQKIYEVALKHHRQWLTEEETWRREVGRLRRVNNHMSTLAQKVAAMT